MNAVRVIEITAFWAAAGGVVYAYALYPFLIWVLSRAFGREPPPPAEVGDGDVPMLSVLIAAHNEAAVIAERVVNVLSLDYPPSRLDIVVASDGSDDSTVEVVERFGGRGVRLLDLHPRRGKASVLNAAFPELRGDIVLLSDANTFTDPSAARALVRWFADPAVGVVCGRLILTDAATGKNADGLYWKYETFLKKCESRLGALLGSNGAIYAIRREQWAPIPPQTIVDDFVIPLLARKRTGCRIIYDPDAVAHEETAPDLRAEFRRRARIGAGGFQAIGMLWRLLDPRRGWIAFTFLSHKVMRWFCPFFLIVTLVSSLLLWPVTIYRAAFLMQAGFYLLSYLTTFIPPRSGGLRFLTLAPMFTGMNLALLVGFWRWIAGIQGGAWERTAR